jgi:hypothetical protein
LQIQRTATLGLLVIVLASVGGCDDSQFDEAHLYKGMDRSLIIAKYGRPDKRKARGDVERLIYTDGEHYQYLLLLDNDKLQVWHKDRTYKENRYSNIRNAPDLKTQSGR